MGIGRVLGAAAPIAAGYFTGGAGFGLGAQIAAGAATGAGIAALSGDNALTGALTGGLGGMSGGAIGTAKSAADAAKLASVPGGAGTTGAANKIVTDAALQSPYTTLSTNVGSNLGGMQSTIAPAASSSVSQIASGRDAMQGVLKDGVRDFTPGGYEFTAGERAILGTPDTSVGVGDVARELGGGSKAMGYGKMGLTGLGVASGAGAFDPDMPTYEDDPRNKYDPKRRLDLGGIDTGLTLNKDTGLRLLAEGGEVKDRSYYGITPQYQTVQPQFGSGMPYGGQSRQVRVPVRGFVDVGGKFKADPKGDITDMEYEDRFKYVTEGTTAEQNQAGGDMDSINKAAKSGQPNAGAVAALAKGFAKQQTEGPTKSQTLGLQSLEAGGYLETGGEVGDGMADKIPASIDGMQEARLSDGEFVVPADVVSHLGNGSSDAGAKRLYEMMDKVRMARTGTKTQGKEIQPERYMPR
jgi:hypothetical protein